MLPVGPHPPDIVANTFEREVEKGDGEWHKFFALPPLVLVESANKSP